MKKLFVFLLLLWSSLSFAQKESVPNAAEDICPILIGETIPAGSLQNVDGESLNIKKLIKKQKTVLVFYRGNWCPYCNLQLNGLQEIEKEIHDLGFQVLAISADKPEKLKESAEEGEFRYQLLSDSKMEYARKLGIAFQLDNSAQKRYRAFGVKLEEHSGETHYQLPAPAVFVLNTEGEIQFSYINPNFKVRLSPEILLAVLKATE
ncbi:peroxiredoxin-like family protein [Saprospira sp. CCB-QB6]|uniref:peroxiredoxin-like family protein n=1 Tax=Saprospira sp. CCB-QB6 TaxID=3023936 RepID=UPI00234B246D|nr:peroxiredoxin-like family protein [Saprospira sp. CCB-QB6]WCL81202.1 peroxiredoxin-like family protein [Saprospira sp. CCB-QB6]